MVTSFVQVNLSSPHFLLEGFWHTARTHDYAGYGLTRHFESKSNLFDPLVREATIRAFGALLRDPGGDGKSAALVSAGALRADLKTVPFTANVGDVRVLKFQVVPIVIPRP